MYMNNNIDLPHMIYQEHKGDDDLIIEKLEKLIQKGRHIRSKNLVARICETNNIKLLTYLIGVKYQFNRLPVYICALEGHKQLLSILLQYQNLITINFLSQIQCLYILDYHRSKNNLTKKHKIYQKRSLNQNIMII